MAAERFDDFFYCVEDPAEHEREELYPPRNEMERALDEYVDSNEYDRIQSLLHKAACEAFVAGWKQCEQHMKSNAYIFMLPILKSPKKPGGDKPGVDPDIENKM